MNIFIFQSKIVAPNEGGISRMSKTYFDFLTQQGYNVWYLSLKQSRRMRLPEQLIVEGESRVEQHDSFCRLVKHYNIQLFIYQDGISPFQNFILRWARECGLKIIDIIHSTLSGMYGINGHPLLSKIKPMIINMVVNKACNCFFMIKYGRCYREQFKLSDKVVLLSNKFRNEITYFTGWKDFSKFTSIHNPLTLDYPNKLNPEKKKIVLHVALFNKSKRQDLLLDIWHIVEKQRPDWTLKIVGDGAEHDKLLSKKELLKLEHVDFEGFQDPQPYYDEASIFCLTSAFESFGLVLVEAMAFGCVPLAFSSFETATDIISDGVDGILVTPFNVEEYAQQLIRLIDEDTLRKSMAQKAALKSRLFDKEEIMPKWLELIDDITCKK